MNEQEINQLADEVFEQNKARGWWDDMDRDLYLTLQLVSTEIAEATEGERKGLMDDHLKHRKMGEVELADAAIRMLDLAGRYKWVFIVVAVDKNYFTDEQAIATDHFFLNMTLSEFGLLRDYMSVFGGNSDVPFHEHEASVYSTFMSSLMWVANKHGYDLWGAVKEKLEYNKVRSDHDRKVRAGAGGKKF